MTKFLFWALTSHGPGISGGDRIYIELARRWSKTHPVTIVTWKEGIAMMARNNLTSSNAITFQCVSVPSFSFLITYVLRISAGLVKAMTMEVINPKETYLYSASEFWMDSLPCFVLKLRYPDLIWLASWYQTAPSPLIGFKQGVRKNSYRLNALLLWLTQLPIKPLINHFANYVLINNDVEKETFPQKNTIVVLGAVDTQKINNWRKKNSTFSKKYSAVFQGRLHPQKGVLELIDIWRRVVDEMPQAKLAMIGDGPLMLQLKIKIKDLGLEGNVDLFGFVFDGSQKYRIFSQSKLVVHPAFFDSGGMASAEAMAFGLPVIGFDLPSYKSYYPVGMVKVPIGDIDRFADLVLKLLRNSSSRKSLGQKAKLFIEKQYSWDQRAKEVLAKFRS